MSLLDSYFAMMGPLLLSVLGIFLFRLILKTFPIEIISAGRLDGLTETEMLVPSAVAALAVVSITQHGNDLYRPLILATLPDHAVAPVG